MEPIYQGYIQILNHGMLFHWNKTITEQEIIERDSDIAYPYIQNIVIQINKKYK